MSVPNRIKIQFFTVVDGYKKGKNSVSDIHTSKRFNISEVLPLYYSRLGNSFFLWRKFTTNPDNAFTLNNK